MKRFLFYIFFSELTLRTSSIVIPALISDAPNITPVPIYDYIILYTLSNKQDFTLRCPFRFCRRSFFHMREHIYSPTFYDTPCIPHSYYAFYTSVSYMDISRLDLFLNTLCSSYCILLCAPYILSVYFRYILYYITFSSSYTPM